jgi:hypothetical protein
VREVPKAFDQMKMGGGKFLILIDNLGKQFDGVLLNFQAIAMLVWQIKKYLLCLIEFSVTALFDCSISDLQSLDIDREGPNVASE